MDTVQTFAPQLEFPVRFEAFVGERNATLRGVGEFAAAAPGGPYVFAGRKRGWFAGGYVRLEFTADQIRNVRRVGRAVTFDGSLPAVSEKPFLFYCPDEASAAAVVALLPRTCDDAYLARIRFYEQLRVQSAGHHRLFTPTNLIIAANVLAFVALAGFAGAGWLNVTDLTPYVRFGANNGAATTDGQWWRLVASMFLHFGLLHLACNMWALFQIGPLIERLLGRTNYVLAYFAAGIGGSLASIIWNGDTKWSAGASGAVFGMYGALLGCMVVEQERLPRAVYRPLIKSALTFSAYNLLFGMAIAGIDNAAHIGGLATGAIFGAILALPIEPEARARRKKIQRPIALAACLGLAALAAFSTPRFDYSVTEERAWANAIRPYLSREAGILTSLQEVLTDWRDTEKANPTLVTYLDHNAVPFYREFAAAIDSVRTTAGRRTAKKQELLRRFVNQRLESFADLRHAAVRPDESGLMPYFNSEVEATRCLRSLNELQAGPRIR